MSEIVGRVDVGNCCTIYCVKFILDGLEQDGMLKVTPCVVFCAGEAIRLLP